MRRSQLSLALSLLIVCLSLLIFVVGQLSIKHRERTDKIMVFLLMPGLGQVCAQEALLQFLSVMVKNNDLTTLNFHLKLSAALSKLSIETKFLSKFKSEVDGDF